MEDGSSMPLWGLFVLLLLLWLNGIFYGFAAALRNISENDTQKKAEEGDKKSTDADGSDRQTGAVCQCNSADRNGMWYLFWYFSGPICCGCILSIHKACACTDPGNGVCA